MRLSARPNLNGNSPEDFRAAGLELSRKAIALRDELVKVRAEIMHGRNYQTGGDRDADLSRLNSYLTATYAVEQLGIEIGGQACT